MAARNKYLALTPSLPPLARKLVRLPFLAKSCACSASFFCQGSSLRSDEHDRKENQLSLERGFRLLSAYFTNANEKIWLIAEQDRSATTLLLPEEY